MWIALYQVVVIGLDALALQTLAESSGSRLAVVVGYDNRAYHEAAVLKFSA